jgi:signal transduction histidine kinase
MGSGAFRWLGAIGVGVILAFAMPQSVAAYQLGARSERIIAATPPWRTWWAYALYGLAGAALVAGAARAWTQERANRALAHEIAERRRAEAEQQRLYAVATGLREVVEVINSNRPLPDVLQFIVEQACRLLVIESGQIYRLLPPRASHPEQPGTLRVEASEGISSATVGTEIHNLHLTISYEAIRQRRPVAIADGDAVFERILAQPNVSARQRALVEEVRSRFRAILAAPLIIGDEVYGTITLYNVAARSFSDEEINLAQAFARQSALAIANARLRQQAARAALREERTRLARELHDSVTQALYSLGLLAQSWRLAAEADGRAEGVQHYGQVVAIAHQALKEMRLLINELRLPELESAGLLDLIRRRLETVERRVGIEARLISDGELDLPPEVLEQLYRIIQEVLNNALKHAHASALTLHVQATPADGALYRIAIADNGCGFDPATVTEGYGLAGMRERAAAIGATLTIVAAPGGGTQVEVWGMQNAEYRIRDDVVG